MPDLVSYKRRSIDPTKPVRVYRNLHKKKDGPWYSVQQGGRVVAHARCISVQDAKFVVNEAGRQRVVKEKRKNVHAFVEGRPDFSRAKKSLSSKVFYNPYKGPYFTTEGGEPVHEAKKARLNSSGASISF